MNRELTLRVLSSLVGIPLAILLVYEGGALFAAAILLIALRGMHEFATILRAKDVTLVREIAFPAVAVLVLAPFAFRAQVGVLYATTIWVTVAGSLAFHVVVAPKLAPSPDPRFQFGALLGAGATVLTTLYVSLFSFFIMLRQLTPVVRRSPQAWEPGARLLLLTLVTTWSVDASAYFIGKSLGRRKLAPRVSPGKSLEGALGGWLVGAAMTVALAYGFGFGAGHGLALGVMIGCAGQMGDLCKSVIKRDVGVKDFPALIPGHGGVMDRFDSLLFNVPLVFVYITTFMGMEQR